MLKAILREASPSIGDCELTHLERVPISFERVQEQHAAYEACLKKLGCDVIKLAAEPDLPDSVFVEDAAVVLGEVAVLTRPGAASRRPELDTIAAALQPYREVVPIREPGTLDGGDVARLGKDIFVGLSSRTNQAGIDQLAELAQPYGYRVHAVAVEGCLHLKSAMTSVGTETLLVNRAWLGDFALPSHASVVEVDPSEPFAANALLVGETVVFPEAFPKTRARLEERGLTVITLDASEIAKAEGALTCCSLIFQG